MLWGYKQDAPMELRTIAYAAELQTGRSYGAEIIFDVVVLQTGRSYGAENDRGRWGLLQTGRSYGAHDISLCESVGVRPRKARSGAEQRHCFDVCLIDTAKAGRLRELAAV